MKSIKKQMDQLGYAIIENFLSPEEVAELKEAGNAFCYDAVHTTNKVAFSPTSLSHATDTYFLDSAGKISYFYEADALSEDGTVKVDPKVALGKVGHALHWLHPAFKKATFNDRVKSVCRELNMERPVLVQSMYIYKNPKIGCEASTHQDATYLYTEPVKLYGFWLALDDATLENGCLQFVPVSHTTEVTKRFVRNPDKSSGSLVIHVGEMESYQDEQFVFEPVKKGTCVLIHGKVVHRSFPNTSDRPRHAYTFHVVDSHESTYSPENWLQAEFHSLYDN